MNDGSVSQIGNRRLPLIPLLLFREMHPFIRLAQRYSRRKSMLAMSVTLSIARLLILALS